MERDLKIRGYTVAQFPNAPLIVALLALVAGWLLAAGSTAHAISRAVFFVGLAIWAWEELSEGVNGFRRALGLVGLVLVVAVLADDLG